MNDKMNAACARALTGIAEFQALWIQQLPPERLEQLHALIAKGIRLGFVAVGGQQQSAQLVAIDEAGGWVTLENIQIQTSTSH